MAGSGVVPVGVMLNGLSPSAARAADAPAAGPRFAISGEFNHSTVPTLAKALAKSAFVPLDSTLPDALKDLSYDQYRDIRFKPEAAIYAGSDLPLRVQLFSRGFYYRDPVEVAVVDNGTAKHIAYDPNMFTVGPLVTNPLPTTDVGFSGIRFHGLINKPDVYDEIAVFQGASYFRSLGQGQSFGLSARGLALRTADREGEEFPTFRAYWIETPTKDNPRIVVSALLDSPSCTGAYRFTIRPGSWTQMDVEAVIYPRVDLDKVGLAPATSMYYFGSNDRGGIDDFRPQVHDSDGLLMVNGRGERLWRPISNPADLQISAFSDAGPRGFGLMQRDRNFQDYQDLEANYERRPSLWIEPVGDWGNGAVTLVEIPTTSEFHDNVVAYWAPAQPVKAGSEYFCAYRMAWGGDPQMGLDAAYCTNTRVGRPLGDKSDGSRLFVLDYRYVDGIDLNALGAPKVVVSSSKGQIRNIVVQPNQMTGGLRVSFELDTANEPLIELRGEVQFASGRKAETWMYRWTA